MKRTRGKVAGVAWVLLAVVFVGCSREPVETLPAPVDVPPPPPGLSVPGTLLPPMAQREGEEGPVISAISDVTFPNETLVVTGANLEGARLRVWVEGEFHEIDPLRSGEDRMFAVVSEGIPMATMLVWPEREGKIGVPIRVNGATAWWAWPQQIEQGAAGATIRIFGKSLQLEGDAESVLVLMAEDGTVRELEILAANPYHLEGRLPEDLQKGAFRVFAHNGTGGDLGWSRDLVFEVVEPLEFPDAVFAVDDYLETADGSDREAILLAVKAAEENGGGTVEFAARVYRDVVGIPNERGRSVKDSIVLPDGVPMVLRGAGVGDFTWSDEAVVEGEELLPENWRVPMDAFSGEGTVVFSAETHTRHPVFELRGRGQRIENMTIVVKGEAARSGWEMAARIAAVHLLGPDQKILGCRIVRARHCGHHLVLCAYDESPARQEILDTEFFHGSRAITLSSGTDFVRVAGCSFTGHHSIGRYAGVNAVVNRGGNHFVLEESNFTSLDRTGGRIQGRTYLAGGDPTSFAYLAGNVSEWVGTHSSVPEVGGNGSEQYLFHVGSIDGGLFGVHSASAREVVLEENAARVWEESVFGDSHRGPTEELGTPRNGLWAVFVAAGKGVGQWRFVDRDASEGAALGLATAWRVIPDSTSKVNLQRVFAHNIVFNNTIIPAPDPAEIEADHKTVGVYWYHNCFDNITAANTMRNIGTGVAHAFQNRGESITINAWNLTRDNYFENVTGTAGGTAALPMFYSEHHRGGGWSGLEEDFHYWTAAGNVFRSNIGEGADAIAQVSWHRFDEVGAESGRRAVFEEVAEKINYTPETDKGILLSVIENNVFTDADRGILLSAPSNWTLLRNNIIELRDPDGEVIEYFGREQVLDLLVIEPQRTEASP